VAALVCSGARVWIAAAGAMERSSSSSSFESKIISMFPIYLDSSFHFFLCFFSLFFICPITLPSSVARRRMATLCLCSKKKKTKSKLTRTRPGN
jgi:heme/copper-type cytochrome/quinol oxidase subunit 3